VAEPEVGPVPDGSVAVVLDWVGSDPDRARAALHRENAKPDTHRRTSLIRPLESLVGDGPPA
jgi:hypothetical protein